MFTGLVEEVGEIVEVSTSANGTDLVIQGERVLGDLAIDHSIAVNGCCQTVVGIEGERFRVTAIPETLRKTTLGSFTTGERVNLERAVRVGDRLGGHLVQGHVDAVGEVTEILEQEGERLISISYPDEYVPLVIPIGSIVIDGVSLTVARKEDATLTVAIIPHTWSVTTFNRLKVGDLVNLEFDMIGKYIQNLLPPQTARAPKP